jgi:hypothetical protein
LTPIDADADADAGDEVSSRRRLLTEESSNAQTQQQPINTAQR